MTKAQTDMVIVENVNVPGSTSRVNAVKYNAMKDAFLKHTAVIATRAHPKRNSNPSDKLPS